MAKKQQRFKRILAEGTFSVNEIWIDTVTGVNYYFHGSGQTGGLTPLRDRNGDIVVSAIGDTDYE